MSITRWERQQAVSQRLRAAWDAHRDGRDWSAVFEEAREAVAKALEADAAIARAMTLGPVQAVAGDAC